MIQEFFYEIIISIAMFTTVFIYFLMARFKHEENDMRNKIMPINNNILQINSKKVLKTIELSQHNDDTDSSFIISSPFKHGSSLNPSQKKRRQIVEVPAHGKILKEHFKEFKGVKILIVEDNIINQKVIAGLLSGSGIILTMAGDGQIALDILRENHDFDMILMDIDMPRIDGFEATRRIRANTNYEDIIIISLSGNVSIDDIQKMTNVGMEGHLAKPLKIDAFYDILYAYTKKDASSTNDSIEVVMTDELNGNKGLSICGGDDEFYKDILNEFVDNYKDSAKELYKLLEEKQIVLVDSMLLDLVGIAANIGADNIKEIALELKETIKDSEEKSYLTLLENYEQHLQVLLEDIKRYV